MDEPHPEPLRGDSDPLPPAALRRDLRRLVGDPGDVPAAIGDRLRTAARARLEPERRIRRPQLVTAGLVAAAAALLILPWARQRISPEDAQPRSDVAALGPADVDGSGRVDILDAYLLERRLRSSAQGSGVASDVDVDGDGAADERDVAAIAALAVRIGS